MGGITLSSEEVARVYGTKSSVGCVSACLWTLLITICLGATVPIMMWDGHGARDMSFERALQTFQDDPNSEQRKSALTMLTRRLTEALSCIGDAVDDDDGVGDQCREALHKVEDLTGRN